MAWAVRSAARMTAYLIRLEHAADRPAAVAEAPESYEKFPPLQDPASYNLNRSWTGQEENASRDYRERIEQRLEDITVRRAGARYSVQPASVKTDRTIHTRRSMMNIVEQHIRFALLASLASAMVARRFGAATTEAQHPCHHGR